MDGAGRPLVAIVKVVARHFPGEDPVGHRISVFGLSREIVGVVRSERFRSLEAGSAPAMYLPLAQNPLPTLTVVLRVSGTLPRDLRETLAAWTRHSHSSSSAPPSGPRPLPGRASVHPCSGLSRRWPSPSPRWESMASSPSR